MSGIPISRKEIEACEEAVKDFRVNELHQLVIQFKYPKLGKKQELVQRAISILNNPKYQLQAVQKVREIQTSIRVREAVFPYPVQAGPYSQTRNNAMHQPPNNHYQNPQQQQNVNPAAAAGTNPPPLAAISPGYNAAAGYYNAAFVQQFAANAAALQAFGRQQQQQQANYQQQQQAHQHVVPAQHTTGGVVRNLRTVELPFYDLIKVIVPMSELPSFPVPTRPGEGRSSCHFVVAPEDIPKLTYPESQELPRYELQLRMFQLETSEEQPDAFPPGSVVRLDEYIVNLPPIIPTNKPNAEQKRYPRPVNLTPYCRPPRSRDRPHRLNFEWNGDKRAWAFSVVLVKRLNSDILLKRMREKPEATRPFEHTKDTIIRRLNGSDEDDVQMDSLKISLIDPLMRTRMRIPAKARDCTHLQTFDLNNYLMMNEKRPGWKCPVCDKNAIYSKLIIDQYFERLLKEVGSSIDEVQLLRDGTWQLPGADNALALDSDDEGTTQGGGGEDDDEDIMIVEKPAKERKKQPADAVHRVDGDDTDARPKPAQQPPKPAPAKEKEIDVICLSSDDDEDNEEEAEQLASAIAASNMQSGSGRASSGAVSAAGTPSSNTSGGTGSGGSGHQQQQNTPRAVRAWSSDQNVQHQNGTGGNGNGTGGSNGGPVMDELARTQVAQHLAMFLQNVYAKNQQQQEQHGQTGTAAQATATTSANSR